MTKTFTRTDVLRFYYNEVTEEEKQEIKIALLWDNRLAAYYQELEEMGNALNKIKKNPSGNVIENILNYSRSTAFQTSF